MAVVSGNLARIDRDDLGLDDRSDPGQKAIRVRNAIEHMRNKGHFLLLTIITLLSTFVGANSQELRRSGFLGVASAELNDHLRKQLGPGETGALVQALVEGGSAKEAGLLPNDIITEVNDRKIAGVADLVETAKRLRAGDTATVRLRRNGELLTKKLVIKPRPYESAPDVDTVYKAVSVDGSLRRTIITAPKTPGKHPAILYITGIGCFSQESPDLQSSEVQLLYGLTRAGYVTIRVEKSGIGDSEGPPCSSPAVDLSAERRGYVAALKVLKKMPSVDPDRVFLVGLSIGGVQAPLIAEEVPVKGIVVINTIIKPFFEYLIQTRRLQNTLARVPFDEIDRRARLNELCNHKLLVDKQSFDDVVKVMPLCRDYITYPASYTYMQQWAALDLASEWKNVSAPVLIIYGTADYVSNIADDPYMADVLNSFHPGSATLKEVKNMDHPMYKAASMAESINWPAGKPREFQTAVLDAVRAWLEKQIG